MVQTSGQNISTSGQNISTSGQNISEISPSTTKTPVNNQKPTYYKRKRNPQAEEAYAVMKKLECNLKPKDDCDIFAEDVACQLRQITDIRSRMIAKHRINQVLFEIGMAQFENNFNPPSTCSSRTSSASQDQFIPIANSLAVVNDILEENESEEQRYTVLP